MTQTILSSDARLVASDYQTLSQNASRIRMTRSIVDGQGFEYCSPCARVSFCTTSTAISFEVYYNNLVTRDDARQFVGAVLIDGAVNSTFVGSQDVGAAETYVHSISGLSSVSKTVSLIWPYADGMDLLSVSVNDGASVTAPPPRPAAKLLVQGDSITQGFWGSDPTKLWSYKLANAKQRQLINLGYGGRGATASDGTHVGITGVDRIVYMIGFNNFYPNTNLSTFQTAVEGYITNARSAAPDARIYVMSPVYSTKTAADYGHSTELQSYRDRVQAAVAAAGDSRTAYINGLAMFTNSADRLNADGIHLSDLGHAEMGERAAAVILTSDAIDPGAAEDWAAWAAKRARQRAKRPVEPQEWLADVEQNVATLLR